MTRRILACLFLLGLVLLAPGAASACPERACDRDAPSGAVTGNTADTDGCCADRCPADAEDSECPPRCSFCSCCPGAAQVVLASPDVIACSGDVHTFVPLARAQRITNAPQHVFRPPR
jgi:hypothetical protein